jgi:hypothetical protein
MCVKIICTDHEHEFNPNEPLELQVMGAKEILVSYDPEDTRIGSFVDQMERIVKSGIDCKFAISVDPKNDLNGLRLSRKLEKLKLNLDINEAVKKLTLFHSETDKKIQEIAEMCLVGKTE